MLVLSVQDRVSMGESAPTDILPCHSDRVPVSQQCGVGHVLSEAPVNLERARRHFPAIFEQLFDLALKDKSIRYRAHNFGQLAQTRCVDRCVTGHVPAVTQIRLPVDEQIRVGFHHELRYQRLPTIQRLTVTLHQCRVFFCRQNVLANQALRV